MLNTVLIALLGMFSTIITALEPHLYSNVTAAPVKRWYSTQPIPASGPIEIVSAWPITIVDPNNGNQQYVYYCYADQGSATNLQSIVESAIQIWAPSFTHSSLNIMVDPGCNGNQACLCDSLQTPVDALVIQDLGPAPEPSSGSDSDSNSGFSEGDDEETGDGAILKSQTRTTLGYDYTDTDSGRHTLKYVGYDPNDRTDANVAQWVLGVAHELGHAIGFEHEHQPDRDDYLEFVCISLAGYDKAKAKVAEAKPIECLPWVNINDCMDEVICQNYELARVWFPNCAASYIKGNDINAEWATFQYSATFDYNSIMIYSSYQMADDDDPPQFPDAAVLVGQPTGVGETPLIIWQGGNQNPALAGLSAGDIARVASLYDKGTVDGTTAMNTQTWSLKLDQKRTVAPEVYAGEPTTLATVVKAT